MVLQDKYKRAASAKYRATHGQVTSNRQQRADAARQPEESFPKLPVSAAGRSATEEDHEIGDEGEEANNEQHRKYSRRTLQSNEQRYTEPEPAPDAEPEPDIDLSDFLARQRNTLDAEPYDCEDDDDDVDESFAHLRPKAHHTRRIEVVDRACVVSDDMEESRRKADAARELKARFSGNTARAEPFREQSQAATDGDGGGDDEAFLDAVLADASGTFGQRRRR